MEKAHREPDRLAEAREIAKKLALSKEPPQTQPNNQLTTLKRKV
ncbi:hypothetical protein [Desulfobulbus sp.]|nr:hypothetical protein [Desulfobulbus sp.]